MKVAICIPYYKKFEKLKQLLNTILEQTFKDYVVIVSDDSSDVRARKLIAEFDDRFVYYDNEVHYGPTRNCNHAIRLAQHYDPVYIKVMHHDDYFNGEESLQEFVEMLDNNPESIFAFSGMKIDIDIDNGNEHEIFEKSVNSEEIAVLYNNKYSVIKDNVIGNPSATLVRNNGIMMDENLIWLVDVDWYIKLMKCKFCFEYTTKSLVVVGFDGKNVTDYCSKNIELRQKECLYVYLKHAAMQDFSYLGFIIQQGIIYYGKDGRFWHENDYLAILKDAVIDKRKICLWGTEGIGSGYALLREKGIVVTCYLDYDSERCGNVISDNIPCIDFNEFQDQKEEYLCIIMLKNAKDVREKLTQKGIDSLPYIERFLRNFSLN